MEIRLLNDADDPTPRGGGRAPHWHAEETETVPEAPAPIDIGLLIRKYWLIVAALAVLGATGGLFTLVRSMPTYRASAVVEVVPLSEVWLKNSLDITSFESNEVNIQTQLNILRSGRFRNRGAERVRSEVVPLPPPGQGLISRLREHFQPSTRDPLESTRL